jgi:hypothetical protein
MHSFKGMEEEVAPQQQHPLHSTKRNDVKLSPHLVAKEITQNLPSFLSHYDGAK